MQRTILHCDMNNFYASVECMLDQSLRGHPVAVGGDPENRHGIILAKNYEAKKFGIQTGEALWQARNKCHNLIIVPPHYFQMILTWKDATGKRRSKSISTGLTVKGNKKRAEKMLMKARSEFNPDNLAVNKGMLFTDFLRKWLNDKVTEIPAEEYSSFAYYVKSNISPYFSAHNAKVTEITDQELIAYFETERLQNGTGNKALLSINRTICTALDYAVTIGWRSDNPAHDINPCLMSTTPYFTDFLLDWLSVIKLKVKSTTYTGYEKTIKSRVIPYFTVHHPKLRLDAVTAKHIQDYYSYEMNVNKVSANTVKHRHANIHKALSYAYKTDLIPSNPADKVELPTIDKYVGHFYNATQIEKLFKIFEGDPAEFGVIAASFYGLRRSEVIGLRWDAIDFENKTITIKHTVNEARVDGKCTLVMADTTKTKSSFRTLPLVAPIEDMLHKMKMEQEENKKLCGNCYCQDYLGYVYVNEIGEIIKPGFLTAHFSAVLKANNMPMIRFHDLRHTCASLLFAQGVSLKEIQAWLGHSTIGTTANIYTHLDENNKLSSANAILSILPKK